MSLIDVEKVLAVLALLFSAGALADRKRSWVWLGVAGILCNAIWVLRLF